MRSRKLIVTLIATGLYLAAAFALKAAEKAGLLPHDTTARSFAVFNGLVLALYGNFIPKTLGRFRSAEAEMRVQAALRAAGRAFMLGGVGYAVTSLLPLPFEVPIAILSSATAYVLGYGAWAIPACLPRRAAPIEKTLT